MPQEPRRPGRVRRFLGEIPVRILSRSRSTSPAPPPLQSPHHLPLVRAQVQPSRPASQSLLPAPSTPPGSTSVTSLPPTVTIAPPSSQPSTPASPPSVQSLPTVLALPQPQPQLPLVQVENLAFVEALQKHIDTLSPEEQLHFNAGSAITPEGLIAQSREYDEIHHRTSRSRRCASRVERFLKAVDSFIKPVSIMVSQGFSSLVVGAIKVTIELGLKFAAFFNKLVEMMELLDGHLGYLSQYAASFNHCKKVREALSSAYGDLLSFCTGARNVFLDKQGNRSRWTSFRVFLRTTWEPFEENFNTLHSNFRNHVDIVIRTAAITEHERLLSKEKLEAEEKENKLRHDLLAWLSELDFDQDHERIYSRRHMDTGNWLVDSPQFKGWENSKESSLLWCYGTPGVGKSVLASLVLETLSAKHSLNAKIGIVFVYFNFQDQVAQKSRTVLSTMIKQLARQKKVLPDRLKQFYGQYYREASFPTEAKLEEQLADISAEFEQVFLVMDAMDEFDDRNGFLPIIRRFAQSSPSINGSPRNGSTKFKIFVTSRRENDIETTFTSCNFPIIEIEAKKVDADIKAFVQCQLNERPAGHVVMNARLKDRIAQTLISKSSGMFLWVRYQLDYLYEQPSIEDINNALNSLPPDMNSTYIRILEKIDKQIPALRRIAKRTLMWVVNAARPLTLSELAFAVSSNPDTYTSPKDLNIYGGQLILAACCNLLTESDGIVRPVHYTVQELLTASDMNKMDIGNSILRQYRSDVYVHSELARTCLQCLLCKEFAGLDRLQIIYSKQDFPFQLYAARYWDYHAQKLPGPTLPADLVSIIDRFFASDDALLSAYFMRQGDPMGLTKINALNYCLAFDMFHLFKLLGRLDSLVLGEGDEEALHHAATGGSPDFIELLLGMGLSATRRDIHGRCPLHYAARAGHAAAAELLLDRGADVDVRDYRDCTPLHLAVRNGYEDVVRLFLYRGADANLTGGDYSNALCEAAYQGCKEIVRMLLDNGADVNLTGGDYGTTLCAAAVSGEETILRMLLDNGADVNLISGNYGTALCAAAYQGLKEIVRILLDNGADVNLIGGNYGTALCAAALGEHKTIVRMLLDNGADVNLTGGIYGSALSAAAYQECKEIVRMLLDNGADVNLTGGNYGTALSAAAYQGCKEIVRMLLNNGADVNLTGGDCGTGLCAAAVSGHETILRMLLDNGADVNLTGGDYGTTLCAAAVSGQETILRMLLDNGADVNLTGGNYGTALCAAAVGEHKTIVRMLLDSGADVNLTGGQYGTALCAASLEQAKEIVQMLLDSGADVNLTGGQYGTALCAAAYREAKEIVQMLLDNGADVNLISGDYGTALCAAAYRKDKDIVRMLLDSGADVNLTGGRYGTALCAAAYREDKNIVRVLLDSGADVNLTGGYYGTTLCAAAESGHETILRMLLDNGADVNLTGGNYGTALCAAACGEHKTIVRMLLDNGADVNLTCGQYGTALGAAAYYGGKEIVRMLLDNGADVNLTGGEYGTALCAAAYQRRKEILQILLDSGADLNQAGGVYGTALCAAAYQGRKEMVQILLDSGADLNLNGGRYGTALCAAAMRKHENIVRMLLDNGAEVNIAGGKHGTALGAAAHQGCKRIVEMLLDSGADVNLMAGGRGSAMEMAAQGVQRAIVQMLLEY